MSNGFQKPLTIVSRAHVDLQQFLQNRTLICLACSRFCFCHQLIKGTAPCRCAGTLSCQPKCPGKWKGTRSWEGTRVLPQVFRVPPTQQASHRLLGGDCQQSGVKTIQGGEQSLSSYACVSSLSCDMPFVTLDSSSHQPKSLTEFFNSDCPFCSFH